MSAILFLFSQTRFSNFRPILLPFSATSNYTVESCTIEHSDGIKLHTRVFKPAEEARYNLVIVLVHPYSVLGGFQGLLRGIAAGLAGKGHKAVPFDMRGVGSLSAFAEVKDVVAFCRWVCQNLSPERILSVGSSAGSSSIPYWDDGFNPTVSVTKTF